MPEESIPTLFIELRSDSDLSIAEQYSTIQDIRGIGIHLDLYQIFSTSKAQLNRMSSTHPLFFDYQIYNTKKITLEYIKYAANYNVKLLSVSTLLGPIMHDVVEEALQNHIKILGTTIDPLFNDDYCNDYFGMNFANAVSFLISQTQKYEDYGYIVPNRVLRYTQDIRTKVGGIAFSSDVLPEWSSIPEGNINSITPKKAIEDGAKIISCHFSAFRGVLTASEATTKILEDVRRAQI